MTYQTECPTLSKNVPIVILRNQVNRDVRTSTSPLPENYKGREGGRLQGVMAHRVHAMGIRYKHFFERHNGSHEDSQREEGNIAI
jgi:hypothetical protein